uniref:Peptidase M14 domain-containing protein n=1 Tax=Glossina brevipalpis TaxID=37001 RepID=A0A1A9WWA7_9MUSC
MFSGGSKDWAYAVKGIPMSFTIELPGKETLSRFELPERMILPISMELLDGFIGMIVAVKIKLAEKNIFVYSGFPIFLPNECQMPIITRNV